MARGKRLTFALAAALLLVGVVAAAGFWGLSQMAATIDGILGHDAALMEHAFRVEAHTLNMRRYEKDVLLGIGDRAKVAESFTKWKAMHDLAIQDVAELRRFGAAEDAGSIAAMSRDLAAYATGFEGVVHGINTGTIRTSSEANEAIGAHQDDARRLDSLAARIAAKNIQRMGAQGATVIEVEARIRATMWAICILSIAVVLVITVLIATERFRNTADILQSFLPLG